MNYKDYSLVLKIKMLILKHGVKYEDLEMFNKIPNVEQFKMKKRVKIPKSTNFQVYDVSTDETLIPSEVLLSSENNESVVKLRYSSLSPLEIKKTSDEKFVVFLDGIQQDIEIKLVRQNKVLEEKIPSEISGCENATIGDFIDIVGMDRVSILFFEGCFNWVAGKPCKFCDLHPKENDDGFKPTLNTLRSFDFDVRKWWNKTRRNYLRSLRYSLEKIINDSKLEHLHIFFMAGNLPTNIDVWDIAEETVDYLSRTVDLSVHDNYLNIAPHDSIERLEKLKGKGIKQVQYNLEVIGEEFFSDTCPGKMGYNEFLNKLYEAVEVYGRGNVRSNFVLGLNELSDTIDFAEIFAEKGVVFDYSVFQPKKCTPYANKKGPNFDEVLDFTDKLTDIYVKYNFKPIFCSLSSRSSLVNEFYTEKNKNSEVYKMNLKVKIGEEELLINVERPEYIYGIEGVKYNKNVEHKEAYIEKIDKTVPVIACDKIGFLIPAHNEEDFKYAKENNINITQVVAPYFLGEGKETVRADKETQKRSSVIAVIKHNEKDEYLCVDCKNRECKSFVLGGIENEETPIEAAAREVKEETGYTDVTFTHQSPFKLINHFYAEYKNVNRYATLNVVFGKLNSQENIGIDESESAKHEVKWIKKDELKDFISINNNKYAVDMILNGEHAFTENGIMINSQNLDGKKSEEVHNYIVEEFGE